MFSVPLAAAGGFAGLWLVSNLIEYQSLDVLTMLGFIILIGTVVNNAILIVHQSLNHMRHEEMERREAIREVSGAPDLSSIAVWVVWWLVVLPFLRFLPSF
jgi:HAE1 family hydrophobic/amphiphilic exporter-1